MLSRKVYLQERRVKPGEGSLASMRGRKWLSASVPSTTHVLSIWWYTVDVSAVDPRVWWSVGVGRGVETQEQFDFQQTRLAERSDGGRPGAIGSLRATQAAARSRAAVLITPLRNVVAHGSQALGLELSQADRSDPPADRRKA
jgi:hypothetical protein